MNQYLFFIRCILFLILFNTSFTKDLFKSTGKTLEKGVTETGKGFKKAGEELSTAFNWEINVKNNTPYTIYTANLVVTPDEQYKIGEKTAEWILTAATLFVGGGEAAAAGETAATAGAEEGAVAAEELAVAAPETIEPVATTGTQAATKTGGLEILTEEGPVPAYLTPEEITARGEPLTTAQLPAPEGYLPEEEVLPAKPEQTIGKVTPKPKKPLPSQIPQKPVEPTPIKPASSITPKPIAEAPKPIEPKPAAEAPKQPMWEIVRPQPMAETPKPTAPITEAPKPGGGIETKPVAEAKPLPKPKPRIPAKAQAGPETVEIPKPQPKPISKSPVRLPGKAQAAPETVAMPKTESVRIAPQVQEAEAAPRSVRFGTQETREFLPNEPIAVPEKPGEVPVKSILKKPTLEAPKPTEPTPAAPGTAAPKTSSISKAERVLSEKPTPEQQAELKVYNKYAKDYPKNNYPGGYQKWRQANSKLYADELAELRLGGKVDLGPTTKTTTVPQPIVQKPAAVPGKAEVEEIPSASIKKIGETREAPIPAETKPAPIETPPGIAETPKPATTATQTAPKVSETATPKQAILRGKFKARASGLGIEEQAPAKTAPEKTSGIQSMVSKVFRTKKTPDEGTAEFGTKSVKKMEPAEAKPNPTWKKADANVKTEPSGTTIAPQRSAEAERVKQVEDQGRRILNNHRNIGEDYYKAYIDKLTKLWKESGTKRSFEYWYYENYYSYPIQSAQSEALREGRTASKAISVATKPPVMK